MLCSFQIYKEDQEIFVYVFPLGFKKMFIKIGKCLKSVMSARIDGLFRCTFKRTEVVTFVTDERFVCVPHPQKQNPR